MANAEKLLHEAQFAFQNISFGESRDNKRNAARAKSLCMKIIRRHPTSVEAGEAHAILRRLGEEAYTSKLAVQHQHQPQSVHHSKPKPLARPATSGEMEALNWTGLLAMLFEMPKIVLAMLILAGLFLFGIFGPLLFVPLVLIVLFTGPFRQSLKQEQRAQMNEFTARLNDYIAKRRGGV